MMTTHNAIIHGLFVKDNVCFAEVTLENALPGQRHHMTWDWLNNKYHEYYNYYLHHPNPEQPCPTLMALTMLMTEIMEVNTANKHRLN